MKHRPLKARNFQSAGQDAAKAKPPSLYDGPGSAYHLAFTDLDFLLQDELRPVRVQLELMKPEMVQNKLGIESTIVLFGSARIKPPETAQELLAVARRSGDALAIRRAESAVAMSHHYVEARKFAAMVTLGTRHLATPIHVVTGGGPGIMEAGNRGAFESGGKSIGLNIVLPHEQQPNPYITPELCFQFHYFALRKMHFLMRAVALACFPGGFGTLDELFGADFWKRLIDFDLLIDTGMISPDDVHLFKFVETAEEGWAALKGAYGFEGLADAPSTTTGEL